MVSAAFSVLLAALGVAHASESCADVDYFLSTTAQEISCELLLSVGQCGCYVYAGEDGMSNWINASSGDWIDGCAPGAAGFTELPSVDGVTLTEEQGNMLVSDFCPGTCLSEGACTCEDLAGYSSDFFLSTTGQEISCSTLSSVGQCGCYLYAGEDGMSNWINASSGNWIDGCAPGAAGFTELPSLDGVTLTEEQGNMLVSDFCPGTCFVSGRCAVEDNPYAGLDSDNQLISLFGGNGAAICSTCAVPGQMCLVDFCTTTAAMLCPATCYQNDLSGFNSSGMMAAYDAMDLTADNDWVLLPFFGFSCDDIGVLGGVGSGKDCIPAEFGSFFSQWALFCPVTCAEKYPKMYDPWECEADNDAFVDGEDFTCDDWAAACSEEQAQPNYYPFLHAITDDVCADLYDPAAAWRASDFVNASLLAGYDAQLAAWSCEAGAFIWYSTAAQTITLYSKVFMDEVRANCGTACSSQCTCTDATHAACMDDMDGASCVVCDARQRRNRRLLFGSLPCC